MLRPGSDVSQGVSFAVLAREGMAGAWGRGPGAVAWGRGRSRDVGPELWAFVTVLHLLQEKYGQDT